MGRLLDEDDVIDALERQKDKTAKGEIGNFYNTIIQHDIDAIVELPSAQPKQTNCEYCHEDSDGYVTPIEKNCHAFIRFGMNGWEISLRAKGWNGSAKIMYCPMCGRELKT